MTEYKKSIFDFLNLDTGGIITVTLDDIDEICILTKELTNFNQQCQMIHEALLLNAPGFAGEKERVVIKLTNDQAHSKIILNHNSDDLNDDYLLID